jgi:hypothetical protein
VSPPRSDASGERRRKELGMFRVIVRYARYVLAALSGVGFGVSMN